MEVQSSPFEFVLHRYFLSDNPAALILVA